MSKPDRMHFQLINTNKDYLEFVVSYFTGENQWLVDGIGWLKKDKSTYYLRLIRRNGFPVRGEAYKEALIVEKNSSLIFKNKTLDEFVLGHVELQFPSVNKHHGRK